MLVIQNARLSALSHSQCPAQHGKPPHTPTPSMRLLSFAPLSTHLRRQANPDVKRCISNHPLTSYTAYGQALRGCECTPLISRDQPRTRGQHLHPLPASSTTPNEEKRFRWKVGSEQAIADLQLTRLSWLARWQRALSRRELTATRESSLSATVHRASISSHEPTNILTPTVTAVNDRHTPDSRASSAGCAAEAAAA